jgi:hypothetical protein
MQSKNVKASSKLLQTNTLSTQFESQYRTDCHKNIRNNCRKLQRMYSKNAFGVLNGDIKGQFVLKNKGV